MAHGPDPWRIVALHKNKLTKTMAYEHNQKVKCPQIAEADGPWYIVNERAKSHERRLECPETCRGISFSIVHGQWHIIPCDIFVTTLNNGPLSSHETVVI